MVVFYIYQKKGTKMQAMLRLSKESVEVTFFGNFLDLRS